MPFLIGRGPDPTWILVIAALAITIAAQIRVSGTYKKYAKMRAASGVTGAQFAQRMLAGNHARDVRVVPAEGKLTDHFDPRSNTVNLSEDVYRESSVASIAIAAHECGHALQRFTGYAPMRIRGAIVPVTNACSQISFFLILLGFLFARFGALVQIGAWVFFAVVIFQLVTLPVELNASARALGNIDAAGVLTAEERAGAKKVLSAAAMTYVAGMLASFLTFLRLMLIANRRR
jgi:Zn-dependent membrane protease YugP